MENRIINAYQKDVYHDAEKASVEWLLQMYAGVLDAFVPKGKIEVLDIGGGSGFFANAVRAYCASKSIDAHITVMDNTAYDTWTDGNAGITFIQQSVFDINPEQDERRYDLVFVNRVLHHLVCDSWAKTIRAQKELLKLIHGILADDGTLCVTEEPANGYVLDGLTNYVIYKLTSSRNRLIINICKKFDAKSAGTGVAFLSEKMWTALFEHSGYAIVRVLPGVKRKLKPYLRIFLLLKSYYFYRGYVLKKRKQTSR